jgi:predicted DNA-binding transcriptional regulator AlpA
MITIISGADNISKHFGLSKKEVYRYLNMDGFPVLPRGKGQTYRVIAEEVERWLRTRKAGVQ